MFVFIILYVQGVLADYKEQKALDKAQGVADSQHRHQVLNRMAYGATRAPEEEEVLIYDLHEKDINTEVLDENESEVDSDEDEDGEFFEQFRRQRIEEYKLVSTLPTFGSCDEISADQFLQQVCEIDSRVIVVVHLYNNNVLACPIVNKFLGILAVEQTYIKFVKMKVSDYQNNNHICDDYLNAIVNIDKAALPMLILYK